MSETNAQEPAGVATMDAVMNPDGIRVVSTHPPILVARCRVCNGAGRQEAFYCGNCGGAGVVTVK